MALKSDWYWHDDGRGHLSINGATALMYHSDDDRFPHAHCWFSSSFCFATWINGLLRRPSALLFFLLFALFASSAALLSHELVGSPVLSALLSS